MRSRAIFLLGLTAAVLIGAGLRLHTRASAVENGTVHPLDADSAYHMRRARFAAANFPRTVLFDPLMNFRSGGVAIWPPLFDLALAAPARLSDGPGASAAAVARGAAWVPVVLAAGAVLLAGALGLRLHGRIAGLVCAAFLAVCPGHILWSQFAHTDQHVAESVCALAVLVAFLASRERPQSPGQRAREAAVGALVAVAVLTWQGAIAWGAVIALSLTLERLRMGRSVVSAAIWALGVPAAVTAAATGAWWSASGLRPPLTYISFGFFQPLFLAALLGGVAAADLLVGIWRREPARSRWTAALAILAAAAVTLPFARELAAGLWNGVSYSAGTTHEVGGQLGYVSYPKNWLHGIFEARPLFADGPGLAWKQLSLAFLLAPLAVAIWCVRAVRGVRPGVFIALAVWGSVTFFLAVNQRLNVYYAAPLAALTLFEAARTATVRLRARFSRAGRPRRALVAIAAGLFLAFPMGRGLSEELRTVYVPGSDLFDTFARMRAEIPPVVDPYDPRLLGPPPFPAALDRAQAVLAPWSLGHWILFETGLPVVANNFGYGFMDSIRFFLSDSETDALAIARARHARWIMATDLTSRMNDYASYLDKPPFFAGTGASQTVSAAYFATMQARLYEFDAKGAELPGLTVAPVPGVRLIYHSKSAVRHGGRWVALWKVFEIVD